MNVDRGLHWYSRLLNLALKNVEDDEGNYINTCVCFLVNNGNYRNLFVWLHRNHVGFESS